MRFRRRQPVTLREIAPPRTFTNELAIYNAEVARGIVHTPEWDAKMAELQREFDAWARNAK